MAASEYLHERIKQNLYWKIKFGKSWLYWTCNSKTIKTDSFLRGIFQNQKKELGTNSGPHFLKRLFR